MDREFKYRNLPDQLADHIVELIALGSFKEGDRLFEKDLCNQLNVSRMPLREALRLLQAQGVVHTEPNRGTFIRGLDAIDTQETLEVRVLVERIALRRLVDRLMREPNVLEPLELKIRDLQRAASANDPLEFCRADLAFHSTLVDLSEAPRLKPVWDALSRVVLVYVMQQNRIYDYASLVDDHIRLLDLIRARNTSAIAQEIEEHIFRNMQESSSVALAI